MIPIRVLRLKELGCLACRKEGRLNIPPELHHPLSGGRRIDDNTVIPLCRYHHQGTIPPPFLSAAAALDALGPSLAKHKRAFIERYGTEEQLVIETERLYAQAVALAT